jgi:hypothetical protein
MKGDGENVPLAHRNGMPVDLRQHLHVVPDVLHPRRPDEHRVQCHAVEVEPSLERRKLTTERVTPDTDVEHTQVLPVQHDHPCAGAQDRLAALRELHERLRQTLAFHPEPDRRGFAPRDHEGIEALKVDRGANLANVGAQLCERLGVSGKAALKCEDADDR